MATSESSTPKEVSELQVVGTYTAPFRDLTAEEEQKLLSEVRDLKPHILWLGLSTPKQERFMAQYIDRPHVPLIVGVGTAFRLSYRTHLRLLRLGNTTGTAVAASPYSRYRTPLETVCSQ